MSTSRNPLKIGISACFFHPDDERPLFKGKTLQYIEQSVAHWIMSQGDLAVMIPSPTGPTQKGEVQLSDYAEWLDAVVLMGGSDVWPGSYGEVAMDPRWEGDAINAFTGQGLTSVQKEHQQWLRALLNWRKSQEVIHHGKLMHFVPDSGTYAMVRYHGKNRVMVIFNKNKFSWF